MLRKLLLVSGITIASAWSPTRAQAAPEEGPDQGRFPVDTTLGATVTTLPITTETGFRWVILPTPIVVSSDLKAGLLENGDAVYVVKVRFDLEGQCQRVKQWLEARGIPTNGDVAPLAAEVVEFSLATGIGTFKYSLSKLNNLFAFTNEAQLLFNVPKAKVGDFRQLMSQIQPTIAMTCRINSKRISQAQVKVASSAQAADTALKTVSIGGAEYVTGDNLMSAMMNACTTMSTTIRFDEDMESHFGLLVEQVRAFQAANLAQVEITATELADLREKQTRNDPDPSSYAPIVFYADVESLIDTSENSKTLKAEFDRNYSSNSTHFDASASGSYGAGAWGAKGSASYTKDWQETAESIRSGTFNLETFRHNYNRTRARVPKVMARGLNLVSKSKTESVIQAALKFLIEKVSKSSMAMHVDAVRQNAAPAVPRQEGFVQIEIRATQQRLTATLFNANGQATDKRLACVSGGLIESGPARWHVALGERGFQSTWDTKEADPKKYLMRALMRIDPAYTLEYADLDFEYLAESIEVRVGSNPWILAGPGYGIRVRVYSKP